MSTTTMSNTIPPTDIPLPGCSISLHRSGCELRSRELNSCILAITLATRDVTSSNAWP